MAKYYYATPVSQYAVHDFHTNHPLIYFDSLTGGDQKISMLNYNVSDGIGNITTKYIPGQTSFSPIELIRAMDFNDKEILFSFEQTVKNMLVTVRQNMSISMNGSKGEVLVWWHLENVIPISITGFSFSAKTNYTDFAITLQAESIKIVFPEDEFLPQESIDTFLKIIERAD